MPNLLTLYLNGAPPLTLLYTISQILAVFAFILGNLAYLQKIRSQGDRNLKIVLGSSAYVNGLHYALLLSLVGGSRHILAGLCPKRDFFWFFVISGTILGVVFWHNWFDIFSISANILACIAVYKNSGYQMRIWLAINTFCWFIYAVLIYSAVGMSVEAFYITSNIIRIATSYREQQNADISR